jgi:hypothetical protein
VPLGSNLSGNQHLLGRDGVSARAPGSADLDAATIQRQD